MRENDSLAGEVVVRKMPRGGKEKPVLEGRLGRRQASLTRNWIVMEGGRDVRLHGNTE